MMGMPWGAEGVSKTAEMVTNGHPDKYCDQLADRILDAVLAAHPTGWRCRVAIEAIVKDSLVILTGEMRRECEIDVETHARLVWDEIGYGRSQDLVVINHLKRQSCEIAQGVDTGGAGDQGIMVGYASDETDELLPAEYVLARRLAQRLKQCRVDGTLPWLRPDGKSQVTLDGSGRIRSVIIAAHHDESQADGTQMAPEAKQAIHDHVIMPVIASYDGAESVQPVINGTGVFTIGGPHGDAGSVGRKIVADAYGPRVPVGGGAYSGKDPTKVDRSAAYMARHIAKTIVQHEGARQCMVQLAYAIGQRQPEMVVAMTESGKDLSAWVKTHFDLSPPAIIERFGLWQPAGWSYCETAAFGHYGRNGFPWEVVPHDVAREV